jgi:hypothetical protein
MMKEFPETTPAMDTAEETTRSKLRLVDSTLHVAARSPGGQMLIRILRVRMKCCHSVQRYAATETVSASQTVWWPTPVNFVT